MRLSDVSPVDNREISRIFTQTLAVQGIGEGPLSGIRVSVKDNIDVAGVTTTAGSLTFRNNPAAKADAEIVSRLRAAGAVIFAKTNMSEFAYSTHGINPNFGTPSNPWDDGMGSRIPGGSSSGAAVAIARGMGDIAIGTDTAGSARVPAALCGVAGFKPSQARVPVDGIVPLSSSYDCVGLLARNVGMLDKVFRAIANPPLSLSTRTAGGERKRLLFPVDFFDPTDAAAVEVAFEMATNALSAAGFEIVRQPVPFLHEALAMISGGGLVAAEAYAYHKPLLAENEQLYDPFTLHRLSFGRDCTEAHYASLLGRREELISRASKQFVDFDALILPTCPMVAPRMAELVSDEVVSRINLLLMKGTVLANILDLPSISLPCHPHRSAPVGLCLTGFGMDEDLLALASAAETALSDIRQSKDKSNG
jgi:aspartyl-tRNA(Asn)/glutamyl-tRNA(Gln) amidotransferase subunit A